MKQSTGSHCLACHCELPLQSSLHGGAYQVCDACAEIIQHASHEGYSRVVKAVCGSLDSLQRAGDDSSADARREQRMGKNLHTLYSYGGRVHLT